MRLLLSEILHEQNRPERNDRVHEHVGQVHIKLMARRMLHVMLLQHRLHRVADASAQQDVHARAQRKLCHLGQ